jgi:hypothetical protein
MLFFLKVVDFCKLLFSRQQMQMLLCHVYSKQFKDTKTNNNCRCKLVKNYDNAKLANQTIKNRGKVLNFEGISL